MPVPTVAATVPASPLTTDPPVDVAEEFVHQLLLAEDLHAEVTGELIAGPATGTLGGELLSAANGDLSRRIRLEFPNAPIFESEEVIVDGISYLGSSGGPLVRQPDSGDPATEEPPISTLIFSVASVTDQGEVSRDGRVLHHLVPNENLTVDPEVLGLTGPTFDGASASVDLFAEPDGTPAIFNLSAEWDYVLGDSTVPASMSMDLIFIDFGQPVTVPAPSNPWEQFHSTANDMFVGYPVPWTTEPHRRGSEYLLGPNGDFFQIFRVSARGYTLETAATASVQSIQSAWADEGFNLTLDSSKNLLIGGELGTMNNLSDAAQNTYVGDAEVIVGKRLYLFTYYSVLANGSTHFEEFLSTVTF